MANARRCSAALDRESHAAAPGRPIAANTLRVFSQRMRRLEAASSFRNCESRREEMALSRVDQSLRGQFPPDIVPVKFSPDRTPRVLCATDLGVGSDAAASRAQQIARTLGARLRCSHVVDWRVLHAQLDVGGRVPQLTIDALSRKIAWPGSAVQGSVRASRTAALERSRMWRSSGTRI